MENKNFDLQELIEKATPKKVLFLGENVFNNILSVRCPNCNKELTINSDIIEKINCCYMCGQSLKLEV